VRVHQGADGLVVEPLFGKSGLIRTLTGADGLVVVPLGREGLDEGERVTVLLFP
jgi:molybdopterin molybdotransferase